MPPPQAQPRKKNVRTSGKRHLPHAAAFIDIARQTKKQAVALQDVADNVADLSEADRTVRRGAALAMLQMADIIGTKGRNVRKILR